MLLLVLVLNLVQILIALIPQTMSYNCQQKAKVGALHHKLSGNEMQPIDRT